MGSKKSKYTITYGGWYQRTTLHLSEIYEFLELVRGKAGLDAETIRKNHEKLQILKVTREAGYLEFVKAVTSEGIEVRYYEDGLYVLELVTDEIEKGREILETYFHKRLNPAINYIFSLGAPIPKVLANIKVVHPTVVSLIDEKHADYNVDTKRFGEVYSKITSGDISVFKTPGYIFVIAEANANKYVYSINEMQIFFREFKDQLERYLDIHRSIWEKISEIKNQKMIKGNEVDKIRMILDSYLQTVSLITHRINQMGFYVGTRASISKKMKIEKYLIDMFQYKFEVLTNSLEYIKEIWGMTREYLNSAIQIIIEMKSKKMNTNLRSLRVFTTLSVVASFFGYFAKEKLPQFSVYGVIYFTTLLVGALSVNALINWFYKSKKYKLKFVERVVDI